MILVLESSSYLYRTHLPLHCTIVQAERSCVLANAVPLVEQDWPTDGSTDQPTEERVSGGAMCTLTLELPTKTPKLHHGDSRVVVLPSPLELHHLGDR